MTPNERKVLTTTSYAILGQLALRPWTMYELARQMRDEIGKFFPRAESQVYAEPKRLSALGLVQSRTESTGRRRRTVYEITEEGRQELSRWLAQEPQRGPQLEFEGLLRVYLASCSRPEDVFANLTAIRAEAEQALRECEGRRGRLRSEAANIDPADANGWREMESRLQVEEFLQDFAALLDGWSGRCLGRHRNLASAGDDARRAAVLAELNKSARPADPGHPVAMGWARA